MEEGYVKADSANLPKVDSYMVAHFFANNPNFCSAEFRNVKTSVQSYADDAVGYVQLKRGVNLCTVKCKMCPEHKVRQQGYNVTMVVNEKAAIVTSVVCHDCPAAQGGCKHAVAFLMWCHCRSEEPSCTSTVCYWKKSTLSRVGTTLKYVTAKEMAGASTSASDADQSALQNFIRIGLQRKIQNCQLLKHQQHYESEGTENFGLHYLSAKYNTENDCTKFLTNIAPLFTEANIGMIEFQTREQHKSNLWHELRYGRIPASNAFAVSRCKTSDGSLVAIIMGAKTPDTKAMKRGRQLEDLLRKAVESDYGRIETSGLRICQNHPVLAASPDGILNNNTIIEIKCPSSAFTRRNYIRDGNISAICNAQVQMQMYATGLKKCLFCVADTNFEQNKAVEIVPVQYDENFVQDLIHNIMNFWKKISIPYCITALKKFNKY